MIAFAILHCDPNIFSANSKGARALCLRDSCVYLVCVTKVRDVVICPTGMKGKNIPCKGCVEVAFSCLKYK